MNPEPVVPISALEHHIYCPRQCALIHIDGQWFDNEHTVGGTEGHRRADHGAHRSERGRRVLRAIPLWSESLGLSGRADIVEVSPDGAPAPVEYKIGSRHGDAAHVQMCAQALCLEEMTGSRVPVGHVWLSASRRRLEVPLDEALREQTLVAISEVRAWMGSERLPPAVNDARCRRCQFRDHCLPEVSTWPGAVLTNLREVVGCDF